MDTAAMWIGYAVMMVGAFVVCLGVLIGAATVSNKMSHMVLDAYGGWKVFLEFREWYHNERPKVGADKTPNAGGNATERSEGRVDHNVGRLTPGEKRL